MRTLVLSHLLPGDEPVAEHTWIAEARKHFHGEIVVGRDRMVLSTASALDLRAHEVDEAPQGRRHVARLALSQTRLVSQAGSAMRRRPGSNASACR